MLSHPAPSHQIRSVLFFCVLVILFGSVQIPLVKTAQAAPLVPLESRFQDNYLSGTDGFLTGPSTDDPLTIALAYLRSHAAELNITQDDLSDIVVKDRYVSQNNAVTHLYLRQRFQGIEVFNGDININITHDGRIINLGNNFVSHLRRAINTTTPQITAAQAVHQTAASLGIANNSALVPLTSESGSKGLFQSSAISQIPIPVQLMYQPVDASNVRLAWDMSIRPNNSADWFSLRADATSGALLSQINWTVYERTPSAEFRTDAYAAPFTQATLPAQSNATPLAISPPSSYEVYAFPSVGPLNGVRTVVSDPADVQASPFGWHDTNGAVGAEYTITRGNNSFAYADLTSPNGYNTPGDTTVDGGSNLFFSSPLDLNNDPSSYTDAAVTNLFYWTNIAHDVFYHYGFDTASGNFQQNTYGQAGTGNDAVNAEAQDNGGMNNANFSTPPDGQPGTMQMFLWDGPVEAHVTVNPGNTQYTAGTAVFGPQNFDLSQEVVLAVDGSMPTTDACSPLSNAGSIAGKIALVDRGTCSYKTKALNVQNAGAVGMLVANNIAGNIPPGMSDDGTPGIITIAILSITQNDGAAIKALLTSGTVSARLYHNEAPANDGDLDSGIILHEFGHGVSTRLTGGPSNSNCLWVDEQAGEGWSDFFALALTAQASDTRTTAKGIGQYVLNQSTSGLGIRRYPYSTDLNVNPLTYNSLHTAAEEHDVGEAWASMLWEVYWNMIDAYGFDSNLVTGNGGNNRTMQLVIDGLKMQPCNPTFAQARDAILAADKVDYAGANQCAIWEGFAKRGLGYSADAGLSISLTDGNEAFDLPSFCTIDPQPTIADVCTPNNATYQLNIGPSLGSPVTLSLSGEPAGSSVMFSPTTVAAGGQSTLTIGNTTAIGPGSYSLQVSGTGSRSSITSNLVLNVANVLPDNTALSSPANNAIDQSERPSFSWATATQATSYTLQVASDPAFNTILQATTIRATSYTLTQSLQSQHTYYWRVITSNGCGVADPSATFAFTVRTIPRVLLVDDDGNTPDVRSYYTNALDAINVAYDVWDTNTQNQPSSDIFANYATVIWAGGYTGSPSADTEIALATFLDQGKCLFISSEEYYFNRGLTVNSFMQHYLGVAAASDDELETSVTGVGAVFGGMGTITLSLPYSIHTDSVSPDATASLAFTGSNGSTVDSAITKEGNNFRTTYWGFGFEGLPTATIRQDAMQRVVNWCSFQADLELSASSAPSGPLRPGESVTYTLNYTNTGVVTAQGVELSFPVPTALSDLQVNSSGPAITVRTGTPYTWQIADIAPDTNGRITITGTVNTSQNGDMHATPSANITTTSVDPNTNNNLASISFNIVVPRIAFSSATYSTTESAGTASITVVLDSANPFATSRAHYASSNGSAQAGSDYTTSSGTLSIPAGQTQASFTVPILNDGIAEADETLLLSLSSPIGARLGALNSTTLTILANSAATTAPQITSAPPAKAQFGVAYHHQFTASGSPQPTFTLTAGNLPPGILLSSSGVLSGTPTQPGSYTGIRVTASNGSAPDATQSFTILVEASIAIPIATR